jgi:UDP-2,3-diacylglucosamine pyrophosphatase LpxH
MTERPLLVLVSDLHLTDALKGPRVARAAMLERFWSRIEVARRGRPAELVFVGDLFDIVRSPRWLETPHRPYHEPSAGVVKVVDGIVEATLERERDFFALLRKLADADALRVHYVLGNHDRLLAHAPRARRAIARALTGADRDIELGQEIVFPEHGVLAHHGHTGDFICSARDGAPVGDAIGLELIVRFPRLLRQRLPVADPVELDDIDDVRPIYAVPAWVRQLGEHRRGILGPLAETWSELVEEFLSNPFVKEWMRGQSRTLLSFDPGKQLRLLLELSTGRIMGRAQDKRLTQLYKLFQHAFDGRFAHRAAERLSEPRHRGLRYVVNGHSHFPSMQPLGNIAGRPACYFNTGTWRTVHQIGTELDGRPAFLPYDAMSYLVFFPTGDSLGRDYEWWTGAMVARGDRESDRSPAV